MSRTLEQLKAAFKTPEKDDKGSLPNNYYPFWNAQIGESVVVRFLPDKNQDNPRGFLVEKLMHTLVINGEKKSVPCLKMYNEDCPVCKVSAQYYKNNDKINGKKFWRKKQHIAQALIVADPLPPNEQTKETHEGKVRYLALGFQLYNIIKEAFEGGVLDEIPYAYKGGTNFIIKKSKQGEYSTYSVGSRFDRASTDLTDDEIAMVQDHLIDLSTLLPKHPGTEKVNALLEAALSGESVTVDTTGLASEGEEEADDSDVVASSVPSVKPATTVSTSTPTPAPAELEADADAILARIRERRKTKV